MTVPAPALLRHRAPALFVGAVESVGADRLACVSTDRPAWAWPEMLEAAAQAAGLLAGLQGDGLDASGVVAEYRDVRVHAARHEGRLRLLARLERKVLHFRTCHVEVEAADGTVLLDGLVTLAPRTGGGA